MKLNSQIYNSKLKKCYGLNKTRHMIELRRQRKMAAGESLSEKADIYIQA